jgi:cellulose synthase/poly-beta-1,6-N-acetylglucosamine synthase-like glycosyltransferase
MNELAILAFWLSTSLVMALIVIAVTFVFRLRDDRAITRSSLSANLSAEAKLPLVTVVLSLRGADPFLPECLQSLLTQDYPDYQVQIVIDSPEDPAWDIVTPFLHQPATPQIKASALQVKHRTCSLKCSALLQAIAELDDACEVVAIIDADAMPHRHWLRELVNPLADPETGVTTGNRWYAPDAKLWGSLVRYLGNIATVVHMCLHQVPWGGSMALKTKLLRHTPLLEQWRQSLVDDVPLYSVMQAQGLRIQFVPSLIMVNREQCRLSDYLHWMKRQLLCVRLYHPSWRVAVIQGIVTAFVPMLSVVLLFGALVTGQWQAVIWVSSGLACYLVGHLLLVGVLEQTVQWVLSDRGEVIPERSAIALAKLGVAIPLAQLTFTMAILSVLGMRQVDWRGITYQINGPQDIHLLEYRPYQDAAKQQDVSYASL